MLTIPMINYLANLAPAAPCSGPSRSPSTDRRRARIHTNRTPATESAPQQANRSPATIRSTPTRRTRVSIQQAWVQHLIGTWGLAANGGLKYYIMDNEPSLWNSTHRDIHPAPVTYDEIYNDYRRLRRRRARARPERDDRRSGGVGLVGDVLERLRPAERNRRGADPTTTPTIKLTTIPGCYSSFTPTSKAPASSFSMCSAFTTIPRSWRTATMIALPGNSHATSRHARFGTPPMSTRPGSTGRASTGAS